MGPKTAEATETLPHVSEDTETGLQNLLWSFFHGSEDSELKGCGSERRPGCVGSIRRARPKAGLITAADSNELSHGLAICASFGKAKVF